MLKIRNRKFLVILPVLFLVIIIGGVYFYVSLKNEPIEDFPEYFVLDPEAKLLSSKAENSSEGPQIRNIYQSRVSVAELAKRYGAGPIAPEWNKTFERVSADTALFSLAYRFSRLGVSVSKAEDGALLVLDYYPRLKFYDEK